MSVEKDDGVDVGLIAAVEIVVAGSTFESPSTRESSLSDWMAGVVGAAFGTTIGVVASLRAAVGVGVAVRGMGERRRRSGNTGRRRNADTIHFSSASIFMRQSFDSSPGAATVPTSHEVRDAAASPMARSNTRL